MTDQPRTNDPESFLGISIAYLQASGIICSSEFAGRDLYTWDRALLLHPVSNILGVAIETALKGMLSSHKQSIPFKHDLEFLLEEVAKHDSGLEAILTSCLGGIQVAYGIIAANPDKPSEEVCAMYRRHHIHFLSLNRMYDRPFAARYPVARGHILPDAIALGRIAGTLQDRLRELIERQGL